jgi:hypothetical protein
MPETREPYHPPTRSPGELALLAARRERALRWVQAGYELHDYPALTPEAETPEMSAAEPPEKHERKR